MKRFQFYLEKFITLSNGKKKKKKKKQKEMSPFPNILAPKERKPLSD